MSMEYQPIEPEEELKTSWVPQSSKKVGGAAILLLGSVILLTTGKQENNIADTILSIKNNENFVTTTTTSTEPFIGMWNEYTELDSEGKPIDLESLSYYSFLSDSNIVEPYRLTTLKVFGDFNDNDGVKFAWDIKREATVSSTSKGKPEESETSRVWGREIERMFISSGYHYEIKLTVYNSIQLKDETLVSLIDSGIQMKQKVTCMYVRRELRALNHKDRSELLSAMWIPYSTSLKDGVSKYGSKYMDIESINSMHNYWAADFECDHLHDGNGFATQHLALTIRYEAAIQSINPKIVMPYWEYTIESADIITNHNGNFNKFYELSVVFSSDWFGSFDTQQEPWSSIQIGKSTERHNSFGLARAPWNFAHEGKVLRYRERCGFNTAKLLTDLEGPSTCSSFASILDIGNFENFQDELMHAPHGSIHILLGGMGGGCDHTYKEQLSSYFSDGNIAKIAQIAAIYVKGLWRAGYIDYTECTTDSEDVCEQACVGSDFIAMGREIEYSLNLWSIEPLHKDDPDGYFAALGKVLCSTKLSIGDMYSSSATIDPLFWVMHTTTDRLMTYKRAKKYTFTDMSWPDSTCVGHSSGDGVIFDISEQVGDGSLLTNYDLLLASDPKSSEYGMEYIYDSFDYTHCGYDAYPQFNRDYYPTDEVLAAQAGYIRPTDGYHSMMG
mmetsp:Transcript_19736/g.23496  ORF Transcript_19736/g.23496 Transcript_19736/m.23496 type:complete len:671 (-) Transcript_19736:165-2177(-)|eukprot:CAMPEP_0114352430 /NCGR_PEP_ID=MMETSP0101-20121206/17949_1 /TAXON_ID=38822 ORGANISM="Pteridomonas danica, Strain PT" /NCGR_SAMPLE_ID=MMETSP0101 /ASSEMBLY_ACC=CAM_ASM_000211 /LENGTH=670 /DNA_ID=CAMNT_0001492845 /DNA_START=65 /DNA_END=2077 /DNA_ORIENTATION=+